MTLELPLYMQNNTYAARLDRLLVQYLFRSGERVLEGFVVSQKAGTQDNSIDVTAGFCVIQGDDIARQGMYLTGSVAADYAAGKVNFVMPAKPGSNSRYDLFGIQVRDAQALGTGANNDAIFLAVQGTASGSPVVPTAPASFLPIAKILRTSTESAILTAAITDVAVRSAYPFGSGSTAPTGIGAPGDIYVQY